MLLVMRGQSQMRRMDVASGIAAYRAGFCTPDAWRALYSTEPAGYWHGQRELPRHLTVHSRGGMGDMVQWARYARVLQSLGVEVTVSGLNPRVLQLMPEVKGRFVGEMAEQGFRLDESGAPMWTDPFTLFTALFPVIGFAASSRYIETAPAWRPPQALNDIRRRARGRPCVGLFWSANESPAPFTVKSLKQQHLSPLLHMPDVHWVIFQRGHQRALWLDDARSQDADKFTTVDGAMTFEESIALCGQLDALVSVDTGLIHACAAMGLPCVLMATPATDWRWHRGDRSDWYPAASIARASQLGGWDELVGRTASILGDVLRRQGHGAQSFTANQRVEKMTGKINNFLTLDSEHGMFIVNRNCALQAEALVKTGKPHIQAELDNMIHLVQHMPERCVMVDGGANIGLVSIPLAKAAAARHGVVHAFEPQRMLNYALCGSVALNDLENVIVHRSGLAATSGTMRVPRVDYSLASDYGTVQLKPQSEGGGDSVDVIALDDLGLERLDFLKLDIEGMEIEALRGARALIKAHQPWCWIEYWMVGADAIIEQFAGVEYEFFKVDQLNLLCAPIARWDRSRLSIPFEPVK
jgi:FkbM family methyltransferase